MAGSVQVRSIEVRRLSRAFWLPPGGYGNCLDDQSWIPLLDVADSAAADELLDGMFEAGIPAHTASVRGAGGRSFRIWVGASRYGDAVSLLIRLLPRFIARRGESVIR